MNKARLMGELPITKLIFKFSIPAIAGMIMTALYNIIDSYFVGNYIGEDALAAVSFAFPFMLIQMAFALLIGIGALTLISIRLGEERLNEAEILLGNCLTLNLIVGSIITIICLPFLKEIMLACGAEAKVLNYAVDFSRIMLYGTIPTYIGWSLNSIMRSEGNPLLSMTGMASVAIINTILNPFFIKTLNLGIAGSALATVTSQILLSFWTIFHYNYKFSVLKLRLKNLIPSLNSTISIFQNGSPPFFIQIAASFVFIISNSVLLKYGGDTAVAAGGVINRIFMLIYMPVFGITQGAGPIMGYNFGAKKYSRMLDALKKSAIFGSVISSLGFILIIFFHNEFMDAFTKEINLVSVGAHGMWLSALCMPLVGAQIVAASFFQAISMPKYGIFLTLTRQLFALIPLLIILPHFLSLNGAWLATPLSDFISSLITLFCIFRVLPRFKKPLI